jgi:uncharacterized damage-inducible protein DinB
MNTQKPAGSGTIEPWLRGTLTETGAVPRAVLHALELAREDLAKWCGGLSGAELNARPGGIAPVAFHLRHLARSLDRLLGYAEGKQLDQEQLRALEAEMDADAKKEELFAELETALDRSMERVRGLAREDFEKPRSVGKRQLPATLGGLLVHVADHTQRHVGQAITTAKIVKLRDKARATGSVRGQDPVQAMRRLPGKQIRAWRVAPARHPGAGAGLPRAP